MKKRFAAITLIFVLCLSLFCLPVRADELWSEDYYRAVDTSGELTDAQQTSLDGDCIDFMKENKLDLALLALTEDRYAETGLAARAANYYESCGFGYGEGHDGFLWVYAIDEDRVELFAYGAAEGVIPQDYAERAGTVAIGLKKEHGVFGVLYGGVSILSSYFEDGQESGEAADVVRVGETDGLPAWYPADKEHFTFYHDEKAPRVVDHADIFSEAEEQMLEARITEIRAELQRDVVIYTNVTDYGLGHDVCAADFFDFNGYGCGEEYEGVCLFIDMDPNDRGWWCACTGSDTMERYTEDIANDIDDVLYEYMAAGRYADGVADWVENIRTLYIKGVPFAPDWYPATEQHHDPDAPRVVDELGLLSEAERNDLTARAAEIAKKYGADVAIHTMKSPKGMNYAEVGRQYYTHMGYGYGEDYDGIILTVFKRDGYYATPRIAVFGSAADKLSETNETRMKDACAGSLENGDYYGAMSRWLDQTGHMLRTGRVARSTAYWSLIGALAAAIGSIFGGISLGTAKAKMAKPVEQRDADAYISSDSRIRDAGRFYLYTTTSRRYDPPQTKSSGGGGSSHRSSYSSSYHGSSGRSHSGSGRRF